MKKSYKITDTFMVIEYTYVHFLLENDQRNKIAQRKGMLTRRQRALNTNV